MSKFKSITNKAAFHNYNIIDTFEAGIKLSGSEVKSIKLGHMNLKGSYINIESEHRAWLLNAHISPYQASTNNNIKYNPTQPRQLLLHKKQLKHLTGKSHQAGITIIPIKIYLKHRLIKIEIAIAKGKKKYDKRETIKKRDWSRRKKQLLKS